MGELIWSTADPDLTLLGRLGLGAIALTLDAADELEESLEPLEWHYDSTDLRLRWPDDVADQEALVPLAKFAWQARKPRRNGAEGLGVLYLPAIHRGSARDDHTRRLVENNGVLSTFLQHFQVQPKTKEVKREVIHLDEDQTIDIHYKEPKRLLRYVEELTKEDKKNKLFSDRKLRDSGVSFSSFLYPGATGRYRSEDSWEGSARQAFPLFFAPIGCFYLQMRGSEWVVVAPDVRDLQVFVQVRSVFHLSADATRARNLADAGLRVLIVWRTQAFAEGVEIRQRPPLQCQAMRIGKAEWIHQQSVRTGHVRIRPTEEQLDRYEVLHRNLPNRFRRQEDEEHGFIWVPRPRGPIANNLVEGKYWYRDLFEVPSDERDAVQNASRKNESIERAWFRLIRYDRNALRTIMEEIPGDELSKVDEVFAKAFHHALRRHFAREAERAKRGTRSVKDRWGDLVEKIRRKLTQAGTRPILRAVLAEFFSEAGSTEELQEHRSEIWRFIDGRRSWRRARDLALLSLATYGGEGKEVLEEVSDEEVGVVDES